MGVQFVAADMGAGGIIAILAILALFAWLAARIAKKRREELGAPESDEHPEPRLEEPLPKPSDLSAREKEQRKAEPREAVRSAARKEKDSPEREEPARRDAPPEPDEPPKREAAAPPARSAETREPASESPDARREASEAERDGLRKGLATTRGGLLSRIGQLLRGKDSLDPALVSQIEEVFITSDIGVRTTATLVERLRSGLANKELADPGKVWAFLRSEAERILDVPAPAVAAGRPHVVMVVGVNGVGKTTTIGKLASRFQGDGKKVLLAAGDTFRAAAVAQLEVWGRRTGCPVVKGKEGADPSSVVFEAIQSAKKDGADYVIVDTAGRLHTKAPLMEELKKVRRVIGKAHEGAPHEVLLVLDATTGQNAITQAQMFKEALGLTGIVLTKLDGTAKGGVILGICDEHAVPVRYIGIGEKVEDLREFSAMAFVDALLYRAEEDSLAA